MALPTEPSKETFLKAVKLLQLKKGKFEKVKMDQKCCNEIFIYRELNGLNFQLRLSLAKCWGVADGRLMKAK